MPTYITLGTYNSLEGIAGFAERRAAFEELVRSLGGRSLGRYLTLGQYDVVVIFEAPDDVTATRIVLQAASRVPGGVRTQTLRALTEEEAASALQGLR